MRTNLRMANPLLTTVLACALAACTTSAANNGTGGSSGGGAAGTPGGSGGSGATSSTGLVNNGNGTACPAPAQLITDFKYTPSDAGATTEVSFGDFSSTFSGETNIYGTIASDVTQSNWHITGTITDYSGLQILFNKCDHLDASKFKGISLTISGSVPHGNALSMDIGTIDDTATATWLAANGSTTVATNAAGRCTPSSNTNNQYYHPGCTDPTAPVAISATPTTVSVTWDQFTGGQPTAGVKPSEIDAISLIIPWNGTTDTPYAVDFTIDDLQFIP